MRGRGSLAAALTVGVLLTAAPAHAGTGPCNPAPQNCTWFTTSASNTYIDNSEAVWYAASGWARLNPQAAQANVPRRFTLGPRLAGDRVLVRYVGWPGTPYETRWDYLVDMDRARPGYGAPAVFVTEDP